MNVLSTIIILLSVSISRRPLLCWKVMGPGYVSVEPAPLFLLGSNLTVYCHIPKCQGTLERCNISLELDGTTVNSQRLNHTTIAYKLLNFRKPKSFVRCKLKRDRHFVIVNGVDLNGSLPPGKPANIICETTRRSNFIDCSWQRRQETDLLHTVYNISVTRENGTQVPFDQIPNAGKITLSRGTMDENTKYQLIISAKNHFGSSKSDPFIFCVKDIVIPEAPLITQMKFENNSMAAMLRWKTNESTEHLRSYIRLRTDNGHWETGERTELSEGLIQVGGLKPLTEYEIQMRICSPTSGLANTPSFMPRSATTKRSLCSKWSQSVRGRSPGKGPSQQLQVWRRILGSRGTEGVRIVKVLWKLPSPKDYNGKVQQYKIFWGNDQKQEVTCGASLDRCSVQVPAEVQVLSVSVVTSYGKSPPAEVLLRCTGDSGPVLRELTPAASGSAVYVSWSWESNTHGSAFGLDLLHYVLEWTSVSEAELQWKKMAKDQNRTSITGLTAGVRYNISLHAVTTRGVSAPSSALVYSKEQKPVSGPRMSVLVHEGRRIRVQWDELPVANQRGFITNYTIYYRQTLDSHNAELSETVSASGPRQTWLVCPEGTLFLQMTASTSAGEGPRGGLISSHPAPPKFGLVIVIVSIITLLIVIVANLLCWSCVRKRIKQRCISWGPAWFGGNLPKPGNSFAIKLLEQEGSEPAFSSTYSDPPLSPISFLSQEDREDMYPNIHVEVQPAGSGQATAGTPFLMSDSETVLIDSQMDHVSYKPQIAAFASHGDEVMDIEAEERDDDICSSGFGALPGGFLSSVEVDSADLPPGLTLNSITSILWPKTPETTSALGAGFFLRSCGAENDVEADSPSLDLQHGESTTLDTADTCLSHDTVEITLTGGYFPQVAAFSRSSLCDTQR